MSTEDHIQGLPTLDPSLVKTRRGDKTMSALQFLDMRGGPTDPIRLHAVGVDTPDDHRRPLRRPIDGPTASLTLSTELDPLTGAPLHERDQAWASGIDKDTPSMVEAVRRYARARAGVNLRSSLMRRGWKPGFLLSRRQLFPLEPPHMVWLDDEAWSADEVCCVTPTCSCRDLSIDFEMLTEATAQDSQTLSVSIDVDRWQIVNTWGKGPTRQLAEAWMAQPGSRALARELFKRAHGAGRQLLDPFVKKRGVVSANSGCPCGSRKKYKRCCGRVRPPPIPGDLHTVQARARDALIGFATQELGEPLSLEDPSTVSGIPIPSEASQWAWLLYWRRFDGFTLADRFLSDAGRGDPWLRSWIEAASGTPPDIFEVGPPEGATSPLMSLTNLDAPDHQILLPPHSTIRPGDNVLGAPVRLMGRTVLEGAWSMPGSKDTALALAYELRSVRDDIHRLQHPDRVLQAMYEIAGD